MCIRDRFRPSRVQDHAVILNLITNAVVDVFGERHLHPASESMAKGDMLLAQEEVLALQPEHMFTFAGELFIKYKGHRKRVRDFRELVFERRRPDGRAE